MVDLLIFHRRYVMSLGPVSLMVIGFQGHDYDFKGKVPRAFRAAHALRAARPVRSQRQPMVCWRWLSTSLAWTRPTYGRSHEISHMARRRRSCW